MIRDAVPADAEAIARIYNPYVLDTTITFEERAVTPQEMAARMERIAAASLPWLVAERDRRVVGYAYAAPWHARAAYRFCVESTVYLDAAATGGGVGSALYAALFETLKASGVHAVIGCVALPNPASTALHEKFGMKKVGHFEQVGFKFGRWIDVGYWQTTF